MKGRSRGQAQAYKRKWPKCRVCRQRFDNHKWRVVQMCESCYGSVPYRGEYCDNVCIDMPRNYTCTWSRCRCPVHAPVSLGQLLDRETPQ